MRAFLQTCVSLSVCVCVCVWLPGSDMCVTYSAVAPGFAWYCGQRCLEMRARMRACVRACVQALQIRDAVAF